MTEPYVVQTFEGEHVASPLAAQKWFAEQARTARASGGTWPRYTVHKNPPGLLFECWDDRPETEGEPRWSFTETT